MLSCMCPGAYIKHSCSQVLSGGRVNFKNTFMYKIFENSRTVEYLLKINTLCGGLD